ncbi:PIN domain-containing protein [Deltaproteobacteria bacterium TL4]
MIFVDTGAWIALIDTSDQYHREAVSIYTCLKKQQARFLTTDYVVDETITRVRYDASHHLALQCLDLLTLSKDTGILRMIHTDEVIFNEAVSTFRKYDSAVLSFTDCVSFAVCKRYEINQTFAFDQHFLMMGISLCQV